MSKEAHLNVNDIINEYLTQYSPEVLALAHDDIKKKALQENMLESRENYLQAAKSLFSSYFIIDTALRTFDERQLTKEGNKVFKKYFRTTLVDNLNKVTEEGKVVEEDLTILRKNYAKNKAKLTTIVAKMEREYESQKYKTLQKSGEKCAQLILCDMGLTKEELAINLYAKAKRLIEEFEKNNLRAKSASSKKRSNMYKQENLNLTDRLKESPIAFYKKFKEFEAAREDYNYHRLRLAETCVMAIAKTARKYSEKTDVYSLLQEGERITWEITDKFTPIINTPFPNYAITAIKRVANRLIGETNSIFGNSFEKAKQMLIFAQNRLEPHLKEDMQALAKASGHSITNVKHILEIMNAEVTYFDKEGQYNCPTSFLKKNFLEETNDQEKMDIPLEILDKLLQKLTSKERDIIIRHEGLFGHESETYKDMGLDLGVSKQHIGKTYKNLIKKLGRIARAKYPGYAEEDEETRNAI